MYLDFFGLEKTPFSRDVDPDCLFWALTHHEALENLQRGIEERKGLMVLIGEKGIGKTTLVRSALDSVDGQLLRVIHLRSVRVSFPELLMTLAHELGVAPAPDDLAASEKPRDGTNGQGTVSQRDDIASLLRILHSALLKAEYKHGCNTVLVIDDAQDLPVRTLEYLYLLSTLAIPKGKLLQTVLIGHSAMALKLELPQLRKLRQSLAVYDSLASFTAEESLAYLQTRLKKIPADRVPLFTTEALNLIAAHGKGNPRFLNTLCDTALSVGFENRQKPVSSLLAREVIVNFAEVEAGELPDSRALVSVDRPSKKRTFSVVKLDFLRSVAVGALISLFVVLSYQRIGSRWKDLPIYIPQVLWGNLVTEAASEESKKSPSAPPPPVVAPQAVALDEGIVRVSPFPEAEMLDMVTLWEKEPEVTIPVIKQPSPVERDFQKEKKRLLREEKSLKAARGEASIAGQSKRDLVLQTPPKKEPAPEMAPKKEPVLQGTPGEKPENWDRLFDE